MSQPGEPNNERGSLKKLTARAAAKRLDCDPDYVGKLCREGKLKGERIQGAWFVSEESLREYSHARELARQARSEALAEQRRQENLRYRKVSKRTAPSKLQKFVYSTQFTVAVFAISALVVFAGVFSSPYVTDIATLQDEQNLPAAVTYVESPFFGTKPVAFEFTSELGLAIKNAVSDVIAFLFGGRNQNIAEAPKPVLPTPPVVPATPAVPASQTVVNNTYPVVERVVASTASGNWVSMDVFVTVLGEFRNELTNIISRSVGDSIDSLDISSSGGGGLSLSDLTDANIPDTITASNYLPLAGGTLTGQLISTSNATTTLAQGIDISDGCFAVDGVCISSGALIDGSGTAGQFAYWVDGNTLGASSTLSIVYGGTGTSTAPSYGQVLLGNSLGGYDLVATSSLGIVGSGGSSFGQAFEIDTSGYLAPTTSVAVRLPSGVVSQASSTIVGGLTVTGISTSTNLAVTALTSTLLKTNALGQVVAAVAGTDYTNFAYPFPSNATSTVLTFSGGLLSTASTTVGDGTSGGGLTINGMATTTNLLVTSSTTLQNFTALTATTTQATTTNLAISSVTSSLLKTTSTGGVVAAVAGVDYAAAGSLFAYPFPSNATSTTLTFVGGLLSTASSTITALTATTATTTYATTTDLSISGALSFGGVTGTTWSEFCTSITGGAGLCDGVDNTGGGGSGLATSTDIADTWIIYGTSANDVGAEAAFTYDDATNRLTVTNASTTNLSASYASSTSLVAGTFLTTGSSTLQNFTALNATTSQATTSAFAITNITSSLLKTTSAGGVVAAVAGTDYATPSTVSGAFPFTTQSYYGQTVNATSTALRLTGSPYALFASSTSVFQNASTTLLSIGTDLISDIDGDALELTATGVLNVNDVTAAMLASANFGDFTCNGTTCALDADTVGDDEIDYSQVTLNDFTNDADFVKWANASSSLWQSANLLVTGSSTLQNVTFQNATGTQATTTALAITTITSSLLKTNSIGSVVPAIAGTDYLTNADIFAYPFPSNATSTTLTFSNGLLSLASTTIGGGSTTTGLTVFGGATTTGRLVVQGTGTSTFANGISISGGCFAVNDTCFGQGAANAGGNNTEVQYNSSGILDGNSGFTFDSSLVKLTVTNASTTNLWATTASTTNLTISSLTSALLSTSASGAVQNTTVSSPLSFAGGTLSIQQANSSQNGYLSSGDWNLFNNKISSTSLSGSSVITYNSSTGVITTQAGTFGGNSSSIYTFPGDLIVTGNATTTNASTTNLYVDATVRGAGLTECSTSADKLLWDSTTGQFDCGTDSGASGSDVNWTNFNGTGVRVTTASNQVLIGHTSTSSLSKLEVVGGATFDNATTTGFYASGQAVFDGNIGVGTSTPWKELSVAGGTILQVASGNPTLATSTTLGGASYNSYVSGKYAYVAAHTAGLKILDITVPTAPVVVGTYSGISAARDVVVSGQYAYIADLTVGLRVVDISNPASPALVGSYSITGQSSSIAISGKYVFINDFNNGAVRIIDVSNPALPQLAGSYAGTAPKAVAVLGKYLYVADFAPAIAIVDISNPAAPVEVGSYTTNIDSPQDIYVSGRVAYVADGATGLHVLNVGNPASPTLFNNYNPGATASYYSVQVAGGYAYLAEHATGELVVADVRDTATTTRIGGYSTGGAPPGVFVTGKYAYVSTEGTTLKIIDINGAQLPAAHIGSLESSIASISENLNVGGDIYAGGGLNVGLSGIFSRGGLSVFGTSTLTGGFLSTASSTITSAFTVTGSTTLHNATTTALAITNLQSVLLKTDASGNVIPAVAGTDYASASSIFAYPFPNNATSTTLTFSGGLLTGTSTIGSLTATSTVTLTNYTGGGLATNATGQLYTFSTSTWTFASSTLLANNNTFSGTNTFSNTITADISGNAGTATALAANGTNCSAGSYALGVDASGNAEDCTDATTEITAAVNAAYPFQLTGNATSTLTQFNGGLTSYASTTIGAGTQITGLTISGGATTTGNLLVQGNTTLSGTLSAQNATTTALAITTLTSTLLKTDASGNVIPAIAGTDYVAGSSFFAYPFPSNATSTTLTFSGGLLSTASTTIGNGTGSGGLTVAGTATSTNLTVTSLTSALTLTGATGEFAEYTGTSCTNQFVRSLSALGAATCATVTSADVDSSIATFAYPFPNAATSTLLTFTGGILVNAASSTITNLVTVNSTSTQATTTNLAVTSVSSALLKTLSNGAVVAAVAGTDYVAGSSFFAYPFPSNATSTLLTFSGGLMSTASTTIGGGTQISGLTVSGGATTTGNAYFAGNVGIGTPAPSQPLHLYKATGPTALFIESGDDGGAQISARNSVRHWNLGLDSGATGSFVLYDNTALQYRLVVSSEGNVGIGTTTPYAKLTTWGSADLFRAVNNASTTIFQVGQSGATTTALAVTSLTNSLLSTNSTGGVVATTSIGTNLLTGTLATINSTAITAGGTHTITAASSTLLANNNTFSGTNTFSNTITADISGNAGTATALAANGANCSAGSYALGVDASGAAEDCTDATTEITAAVNASYPFQLTGNATSTLTQFNGGLTAYASSTIGAGGAATGLTIAGGATTTGNSVLQGTLSVTGNTTLANATSTGFAISTIASALLKTNANGSIIPAVAGTDYVAGSSFFAYPFPSNATSTTLTFSGGLLSTASTTIGGGSVTSGLTVNGTATTTNLIVTDAAATSTFAGGLRVDSTGLVYDYSSNNVGIGTAAPLASLHIEGSSLYIHNASGAAGFGAERSDGSSVWVRMNSGNSAASTIFENAGRYTVIEDNGSGTAYGSSFSAGVQFLELDASGAQDEINFNFGDADIDTSIGSLAGTALFVQGSSGNVGISTTSPWARFSVGAHNQAAATPLFVVASSSTGVATSTLFSISGTGSTTLASTFGTCSGSSALTTNSSGTIVCDAITASGDGVGSWFVADTFGSSASVSTSTLVGFDAGLYALASSTIGDGTAAGGLTILGNATTTSTTTLATSGGRVGIGTTTFPFASNKVEINGGSDASTYLRVTNSSTPDLLGLFAGGLQIGVASGIGNVTSVQPVTVSSSLSTLTLSAGTTATLQGGSGINITTISGNTTISTLSAPTATFTSTNLVGIGTTSPWAKLSVGTHNGAVSTPLFAVASSSTGVATSTLFSISGTGSTTLASTFGTCSGANALTTNSSGTIVCDTITAAGDGVGEWFTPTTNFGAAANSTSTPIWFQAGLQASSTIFAQNIDIDTFSAYKQNGQILLTATTTTHNLQLGFNALADILSTSTDPTSGIYNLAIGEDALRYATSTDYNTALGYQALMGTSTLGGLGYNTAVGHTALNVNSSGFGNSALGYIALSTNTAGNLNTALGYGALASATSSGSNTAVGASALASVIYNGILGGFYNTAVGQSALGGATVGFGNTAIGVNAGLSGASGNQNLFLGYGASFATSISGSGNILIGVNNNNLPSASDSNQLNIQNIIYGVSNSGSFSTMSTGRIGIGTTSPFARLDVAGANNATVPLFHVASVASFATTTRLIVTNAGNVGIGTTSPYAQLSIATPNGASGSVTTLFAIASSTASATTTLFSISNTGAVNLASGNALFDASGNLTVASCTGCGGAGSTFPFTPTTNFGVTVNSTSTPILFTAGLHASSTVRFGDSGVAGQFLWDSATGRLGLGSSTPSSRLSVTDAVATAQQTLAYDNSNFATLLVNATGDLVITTSGGDVTLSDDNLFVCQSGACPTTTATSTAGNLFVENAVHIGSGWSFREIDADELGMYLPNGELLMIFDDGT